jgi:hypothetical protein
MNISSPAAERVFTFRNNTQFHNQLLLVREHRTRDNNNSIQFNSIHVYLRANLTARRPITKYARETTKILQ